MLNSQKLRFALLAKCAVKGFEANVQIERPVAQRRLKQPRIAELVADGLRQRILSGELKDYDVLPKQEDLMAEFGVSPPCIREAFRILETEGLVTVLRGNVGGAVVHAPQPFTAAYMMGLVLESRRASLFDLLTAMRKLEPACVSMCAERADRHATVLPMLRKVLDDSLAAIDDPNDFIGLARQFHIVLATHCGNETMSLVIGSLEVLWSAQVDALARNASQHGSFAELSVRQSLADEHERIYRLIAEGDARGAEQAIREHYSAHAGERKHGFDIEAPISAARLKA